MKQVLPVLAILLLVGCRTEPNATGDASFPTRHTYSVSAKTLLDRVKAIVAAPPISLPIENEQDGRLVTAWQSQTGARVSVGVGGRTWQERTRYTITIAPAWDDPNNKSTIEVTEDSQQRPHDGYEWGSQDPVKRPERAAELAQRIDSELARAATTKP